VSNRIWGLVVAASMALSVLGGTARALAASVPEAGDPGRRPELPAASPRSAPAGDRPGNAVVTDAAVLVALAARPTRHRRPSRVGRRHPTGAKLWNQPVQRLVPAHRPVRAAPRAAAGGPPPGPRRAGRG
jgi:hypothetical protein